MASFFQPVESVPDIANNTRFKIYYDAALSPDELTKHWYQIFVAAIGASAWVLGCSILATKFLHKRWKANGNRLWKKSSKKLSSSPNNHIWPDQKKQLQPKAEAISEVTDLASDTSSVDMPVSLDFVKSFRFFEENDATVLSKPACELCIVTLKELSRSQTGNGTTNGSRAHDGSVSSLTSLSDKSVFSENQPKQVFGLFNLQDAKSGMLAQVATADLCKRLDDLRRAQGLSGLVLVIDALVIAVDVNDLLEAFRLRNVNVVLMCDPDAHVLDQINLGLVGGLIFTNATIMPDGERRDFFRAARLREGIARCSRQLKARPGFFTGFLELWDVRPSAATVRRASKLAEFFGAILEVRAREQLMRSQESESLEALCLSGFDWLKRPEIVELQRRWIQQTKSISLAHPSDPTVVRLGLARLESEISSTEKLFACGPLPVDLIAVQQEKFVTTSPPVYLDAAPGRTNFWQYSSSGDELSSLGCYELREEITPSKHDAIFETQRHLKRLNMLHPCVDAELGNICDSLKSIATTSAYQHHLEALTSRLASGKIRIYKGLDSGFVLPDGGGHLLGVSTLPDNQGNDKFDIYISQKNSNDAATIWHVYLAHRAVPRLQRYKEELLLLQATEGSNGAALPASIRAELLTSTDAELLYLLEQIRVSNMEHPFASAIVECATRLLIQETSRQAWADIHSTSCLTGSRSMRSLLQMRLDYLAKAGAHALPQIDNLVEFYNLLETKMVNALFKADRGSLNALSAVLLDAYSSEDDRLAVEPNVDLFALMFFCALRKLAFEDVYLETTDRCPFFLSQHDQAGVFAELWVLGSQCQIYFGMLPRALGAIIFDRYHEYLTLHPPPAESWNGKDVYTAYSNTLPTVRVEGYGASTGSGGSVPMPGITPGHRPDEPEVTMSIKDRATKLGALSIFCFPAIVDVCLLSFVGRGFYLTAFMDDVTRLMANYAILTSLLMTGGITGWVGSTGGFYMFSFAFDNMTHFLIQRLSASFMLTLVVAFCGFFAFGSQFSWFAGFVYAIYLIALTTFLNSLGLFATMHRLDSPLGTGRIAMWKCLTILFISPILTTFINGHDLLIYLLVIYTFVVVLLITLRNLCQEWTNWPSKIPSIKEKDMITWYLARFAEGEAPEILSNSAIQAAKARAALRYEVGKYNARWSLWPMGKNKEDPFVEKMAVGHKFAMWLLKKETGDELPEMYSTTWFVQLELATANQRQLVKGLKEHSPFITYRYSKYDLGQNVGLFLGALMDHWVSLVMSARNPQALIYFDFRARYGICFGLLYFLAAAVAVDAVLQRYWAYAGKLSDQVIKGVDDLKEIMREENRLRKARYRSAVLELFTYLFLVFGVTTILVWLFVIDSRSIILYFTYVSGYTSVIFFQFNRCFTKSPRLHVITVLSCAVVGFIVGCIMRAVPSTAGLFYDYNIALNIATVPAAIGTFLLTGYYRSPFQRKVQVQEGKDDAQSKDKEPEKHGRHSDDTPTIGTFNNPAHGTNVQLMQSLCLGVDINVQWPRLPEDVRQAILTRVLGSPTQLTSTTQNWMREASVDIASEDTKLVRCLQRFETWETTGFHSDDNALEIQGSKDVELSCLSPRRTPLRLPHTAVFGYVVKKIGTIVQYTAIITGAGPDAHRELWFALRNSIFRAPVLWMVLKIWKLCWWMKNMFIWFFLLLGKEPLGSILDLARHGEPRVLQASRITINSPRSRITGFISRAEQTQMSVTLYDGLHTALPEGKKAMAIAMYDKSHRLHHRQDFKVTDGQTTTSTFQYDEKVSKRWPISKTVVDAERETVCYYDKHGRVVRGNLFKGTREFTFEYIYKKRPKGNSDILVAKYACTQGQAMSISVYWCVQPRGGSANVKEWVPSEKVQRFTVDKDGLRFDSLWQYKHKEDPVIKTSITVGNGDPYYGIPPPDAANDEFGFQKKPKGLSFDLEDLLIYHPVVWLENTARRTSVSPSDASKLTSRLASLIPFGWSYWSKKTVYRKLSTSVLRSGLWTLWAKSQNLDAVSACFADEIILREEPLLQRYWRLRDAGYLKQARDILDENLERIISAIEPTTEASQTCPLLIKSADLFTMGQGKDANQVTARLEDAYNDSHTRTSVIFSDNGCWPDNPGGVSNCRRDLVNGHTTIRGHCLAEAANDYGIPRYQIERNVNSLKILPLWGLDGKTPYHGVLDNLLQTQVDEKIANTHVEVDIVDVFVPLLKQFVRGARSRRYTRADLVTYSNVILKMSRYFEKSDYNKTWKSDEVWQGWMEAWLLNYDDPNIINIDEYFEIEKPSVANLRSALDLYICYFFIYSVEIPEKCPSVFQSTHHGLSSLFGMILKYRRNTTWGIWDHAILWRETCLNISPAQCLLPIPVQSMLLSGMKLACHLAYTHVDVILPCTSVFNPDWEQDIGTDQGLRGSKKLFARKIDPIVNGISNMDAFEPVEEIRSELPTVIMLSNVQFIKDVKNAVLAADVIINKYGFDAYRLTVYGAQDRQPSYALETETLIATRKLSGKVVLGGFGSPKEVLKDAWLFMNSSLSEGLPLAIGEAALSGVPIVATEVGATALVLTDPDDPSKRYGEVVPPNDPEALARAQLSLLAMLGPWTQYTTDATPPPPLPDSFTPADVKWITQRMYDKTADRRALGLRLRAVVLRSFHGDRYLREHEQMYWIQRMMAEQRRARTGPVKLPTGIAGFGERTVFTFDAGADGEATGRVRWQEFDLKKLRAEAEGSRETEKRRRSIGMSEKGLGAAAG